MIRGVFLSCFNFTDLFISLRYSTNLHLSTKFCEPLIQYHKYHEGGVFCDLFDSRERIINQKKPLFSNTISTPTLHKKLFICMTNASAAN